MVASAATTVCVWTLAFFAPFSIVAQASLLMLASLIAALRDPTAAALIPSLVPPAQLLAAQSLRFMLGSSSGVIGALMAALLLAAGGIPAALTAGAVVSFASMVAMTFVRPRRSTEAACIRRHSLRTWNQRIFDGVRAVLLTRVERQLALVVAMTNAGLFPFFTIAMPMWIARDLRASPSAMAATEVAFSLGILIGSARLTQFFNKTVGRFRAVIVGNALLGGGILAAGACDDLTPIALCMVVSGVGFSTFNINVSGLRAAATPIDFRARMAGGAAFLSSCLNPFATQAFGVLIDHSSATVAVATSGCLVLLSTVLLTRNTDLRLLLDRPSGELAEAYGTLYPGAFR